MIEIVGIGGALKSQPYFAKLEEVLITQGRDYKYSCWQRANAPDYFSKEDSSRIQLLYSSGREGSRTLVINYIIWMVILFKHYLLSPKSTLYIVSRFDAAFPLYLLKSIFPIRYIYLDRDALFMSHRWGKLTQNIIRRIEKRIAIAALYHVVPGQSRNFTKSKNVRVVENSPHTKFMSAASRSRYFSLCKPSDLTVYVNGWLVETRGLSMILEAAQCLNTTKQPVNFIVAGNIACDAAAKLINLPNVEYFGVLDNVDALALYSRCHLALCFYDPGIEINRNAEPNKWFDCAAWSIPFVTNRGIATAQRWVDASVAFPIAYDDSKELYSLLCDLSVDKSKIAKCAAAFREIPVIPWDVAMTEVINEACSA